MPPCCVTWPGRRARVCSEQWETVCLPIWWLSFLSWPRVWSDLITGDQSHWVLARGSPDIRWWGHMRGIVLTLRHHTWGSSFSGPGSGAPRCSRRGCGCQASDLQSPLWNTFISDISWPDQVMQFHPGAARKRQNNWRPNCRYTEDSRPLRLGAEFLQNYLTAFCCERKQLELGWI